MFVRSLIFILIVLGLLFAISPILACIIFGGMIPLVVIGQVY